MIFGLSGSSDSTSPLFQAAAYRATQLSNLNYALISSAVSSRASYETSEDSEAVYLDALETRVTALKEAATALTASSSTPTFYTKAVSSSDETAVTGTAQPYTAAATYTLNVTALAREQVNTGAEMNLYDADFTTGLNTISIKVGGEDAKQVSFDVSASDVNADVLARMERVINNADMGVTAQYVKYSDAGAGRLVITGNSTGSNSSLTISDVSSDAVAVSGIDTVTQNVADASYTLNGAASTSGTNTVLAGGGEIEFQLHRADGWDIDLTVGADSEGIRSDIETFAGAYNDLANFAAMNAGGFTGAQTLWKDLSSIIQKNENRLDDIGITVSGAGLLEVDGETLEDEIETSVSDVRTIFSSATGVATKLRDEASSILDKPTAYTNDDERSPSGNTVKLASLTFMQKLEGNLGALDVFAESMAQLTTPSPYSDRSVTSSDESALTGQATRSAMRAWYTINVTALAEQQVNQGAQLDSNTANSFTDGDNTVSIQVGSEPAQQVTFSVGAADTNDTVLRSFADAINEADIGVGAEVVTYSTSGTSRLMVTSDATGTDSAFTISDVTNTAAADSGIDTIVRNAADAAFVLNGEAATSQSNTLSLDSGEVSLTLKDANGWDVRVQVGTDLDSLVDNTEELVNYYNTLVSFLGENAGTYAGASTLEKELSSMMQVRSGRLDDLGITINDDNRLSIDTDLLRTAFEDNFTSTRKILSSSTGVARELHDKIEDVTDSVWSYATPDTSSSSISSLYTSSGVMNRGLFVQSFFGAGSAINLFG